MNLSNILLEKQIGILQQALKISIKLDIEGTQHSAERQGRHEGSYIKESEIINAVRAALKQMLDLHLAQGLKDNDPIHIYHQSSDLNVIGTLILGDDIPEFKVITVMRKHNFVPKSGTISIQV